MALTASPEQSNSKRGVIIGIVIAIHVLGVYVMESGLSRKITELISPPVETKIIEEEKKEEPPPPPPPPPDIPVTPPPFIPPPEVTVQVPPQANAIQQVTNERPPEVVPPIMTPPAPPAPRAESVSPKVDGRKSRSCDDYYPPASNRADETGSVVVKCSVGVSGRCDTADVAQSSGFARLDEAALKCAKEGLRFVAGSQNGTAATMEYSFKVTFKQKTVR
jgi:periplasmic protein TonB